MDFSKHNHDSWVDYFITRSDSAPHTETVVKAIGIFKEQGISPSHAIDIGAGNGRDTIAMLEAGWRVLAIDASSEGLLMLTARAEKYAAQLTTQIAFFEEMQLPDAMFINAGYALPFCKKDYFEAVWNKIIVALLPNGVFSGHFFGPEDSWSNEYQTHSEQDIREHLFKDFKIHSLTERKEHADSNLGKKFWHVYNVVAQKI